MSKNLLFILVLLVYFGCSEQKDATNTQLKSSEILAKSKLHHDPQAKWQDVSFSIRIQEPRIANLVRYSIVHLNNSNNSFTLIRNRDEHLAKYMIDSLGKAMTFLDDKVEIDTTIIQEYLLQVERPARYRAFYQMLYGLPMSLTDATVQSIGKAELVDYNNVACYKIPIELKAALFSKYWNIFIAEDDFTYQGMEIYFPDDPAKGERLYFSGKIDVQGISIPRIRHWHELSNDAYSGSDIIMQQLKGR